MNNKRPAACVTLLLVAICLAIGCASAAAARDGTLQVRRISPSGTAVEPGQQVVIQFDRSMVQLGDMARDSEALPVSITPDPGCQWRWLNTSELSCRLPDQQRLAPATQYRVTVDTALTALDGSRLDEPVSATFETWRPRVAHTRFLQWQGPAEPDILVRFNEPVTADELAAHAVFHAADAPPELQRMAVRVEPYEEERQGPIWLPVPGHPGALLQITEPQPATPLDAGKAAGAARRIWRVMPRHALAAQREYTLQIEAGLRTPLGVLPGEGDEQAMSLTTFGDFAVAGANCLNAEGERQDVPADDRTADSPRCRPEDVNVLFSAPVPRDTLAALELEPAPEIASDRQERLQSYSAWRFEVESYAGAGADDTRYALPFVLEPMTAYTLTVPAGVEDAFGRTLQAPVEIALRTGHRTPALNSIPDWGVLEAGEETIVPLRFTNLDALYFDYRNLFAEDLFQGPGRGDSTHANQLLRDDLDIGLDRITRGSVGVRDWLDGRSGVVWGRYAWVPDGPDNGREFTAQVTPYQVLAKIGHYDSLVWVSRLADGAPVADAYTGIIHGNKRELARFSRDGALQRTDDDGLARLPGTVALGDAWFNRWQHDNSYYVGVVDDHITDMALLPMSWTFDRSVSTASDYDFWSDTAAEYGHMRVWAITSQGLYRPGSEVPYTVFVRDVGSRTLKAPPALDYRLTITDPKGNDIVATDDIELSAYGDFQGTVEIPATAPMGTYVIRLSWPTDDGTFRHRAGEFKVTDFVPTQFQVETLLHGRQFQPGDTVAGRVEARLHAGGPYSDADVKLSTRLVPRRFAPDAGIAGRFRFGPADELPDSVTLAESETKLDHQGRVAFDTALPADTDIIYGDVRVVGQVSSARSTWVTNSASAPYTARDRFVGLRTDDWMQTAGEPFSIDYIVVDPDGALQAEHKVELELQRRDVARVRSRNGADEFDKEEHDDWRTEDECAGMSAAAPASCELTPEQAGRYRVVATVADSAGRTQRSVLRTWVIGGGFVVWSSDSQGVTLVPDQAAYEPGDTAHVLIQNPYGEQVKALLTVERYGILWHKVVQLEGSAPVVDIPIEEDFFPGAYLSVAIFSPRVSPPAEPDLGKPELALGYLALRIVGEGSALHVDVTPEQAEYEPRDTVHVDVQVSTAAGEAPGRTRLVAAVVDQGVLDLLADGADYFDPLATFYAPPDGPDIANYSIVEKLLTRLEPKAGKGETPGGGGGAGPAIRSDLKHASYWNATLETDADGHAQFDFAAPDNLTRWRILVVAMRPADAMGLSDDSVQVNLPLQIKPALPNQVRAGDAFGAAFNVTNRTDAMLDTRTRIQAEGAIEGDTAAADSSAELAAFEHDLSWLWLTAAQPGAIDFLARTEAGDLGDAMRTQVPVLTVGTEVNAAEYGSTVEAGDRIPVRVPDDALAGTMGVDITLSPTLVGGLDGAFRSMRDEHLQTWEMRLSRAVLAADYLQLQPVLGDSVDWPDAADVIAALLASATQYQAPNGGMAYWIPRNRFVSKYLSVYTALAFSWLREAGYTPSRAMEKKLWSYLIDHVIDGSDDDEALAILKIGVLAAQAGYPDDTDIFEASDTNTNLYLEDLDLFGTALALQVALDGGDDNTDPDSPQRQMADHIVKALLSHADESGGGISFSEQRSDGFATLLSTPLRANCAILEALTRYKSTFGDDGLVGDTPQKLMRWIAAQRDTDGSWPNSQENVFCTTATAHYAEAYEPPVAALRGRIRRPNDTEDEAPTAQFDSRAEAPVTVDGPTLEPGQSDDVVVEREGEGRLYYHVNLHYAMPPHALAAADAGLSLQRQYRVQRDGQWQAVDADTTLERGDIVRVDLIVDAPSKRHHVLLTDPLPGAFEAVNRELAAQPQDLPDEQDTTTTLMFTAGPWPNMTIETGGFYHRETGFDAVRFYADNLPAGRYRLVYSAQVIAPGEFIAPAPTVREVYQPDVFGRDTAQDIRVAPPED